MTDAKNERELVALEWLLQHTGSYDRDYDEEARELIEFTERIRSEHAAELERAMAVVCAAVKQCEWDRRIGTDELRDTLIAQGFITGERR